MPNSEPSLPELDAALTALEHSVIGQTLQSAGAALTPAPAFAQQLETQLRARAQGEPAPRHGAWSGLFASRSRRFVAAVVALLLLSGCGALALAASGQRVAGLPAPWPNTSATFSGSGALLVVIAALGVFGGVLYWWLHQHGSFVLAGMKGVNMQNLKHFLWRTRSVSLTAVVVLTLTAVFWTLGAGASPFHDNNNQLPVITLQTTTGTDTTTTGTTTTGTTTTGTTTTATTSTGTTTTATTTTGTTTTATTTTGTTTTGTTTTGTTSTSATTTGPGALPAQSNACDQKHPDQGNDTQGGQPGTPGHNNPRCFATTTGTTTAGSSGTATTTTTTEGSALPAQSNACDDKHPDQGNDDHGHNNPHCASATGTTSASTSATTGEQNQGDNDQGDQGNGDDNNGDHGNGNGHGNGNNDNPAPAKPVPPSNGNGNGNGGNGGNNGGSHSGGNGGNNGNGNGGGKHK